MMFPVKSKLFNVNEVPSYEKLLTPYKLFPFFLCTLLLYPLGIKIGSKPKPFSPFIDVDIVPSVIPTKFFIIFPFSP